jgi:small subunit ribosomal protein S21
MIEVRMKKGEQIDRALRRLKKKLDKEGVLKEIRNRRHFEKPSEKRRRAERRPRMSSGY